MTATANHIQQIELMYRAGFTLQQIGNNFGVTRERIRQLLRKFSIAREVGGSAVRAARRQSIRREERESETIAKWGMSRTALRVLDPRIKVAFSDHKRNAKSRGIPFKFTLAEWLEVWNASGKWAERGRGHGYGMARFQDRGAYEVGNVYIASGVDNIKDYWRHRKASLALVPSFPAPSPDSGVSSSLYPLHSEKPLGILNP